MFVINDNEAVKRAVHNYQRFMKIGAAQRPTCVTAGERSFQLCAETIFGVDDPLELANVKEPSLKLRSIVPFTVFACDRLYEHHILGD